jgi:predicted acetyltransferase
MSERFELGMATEPSEHTQLLELMGQSLGFSVDRAQAWLHGLGTENVRIARAGGRVAGVYAIIPMGLWFGGRAVATGGIAAVAVAPEDRSSGVGSVMMRHAIGEMRAAGHALSALYPATYPVYRRAGFETAGTRIAYWVDLHRLDMRGREPLTVEPYRPEHEAAVHACHERRARRTAGNVARTPFLWSRLLTPVNVKVYSYVVKDGSRVDGFVAFSQRDVAVNPRYELAVRDVIALTPSAGRRILRLLADHRSMADLAIVYASPSDPLLLLPGEEPRRIADHLRWMVRVLDVPAALEARGWTACVRGEVALDVRDDLVPENHATFVLSVENGRAAVHRTRSAPRAVAIDVRALAALYTGYASAEELRVRGGIDGDDDDLARLTSLFAGPAPWMAEIF